MEVVLYSRLLSLEEGGINSTRMVQSETVMQGRMLKAQPNCSASRETSVSPSQRRSGQICPILPCNTGEYFPAG